MSSNMPPDQPGQPEYLAQGTPVVSGGSGSKQTRLVVVGAAALAAVGVVGVGAWGVTQLLGGGAAPAAALPDSTLAYASIDLDPSAGQKIQAIRTLKKFPAVADELDLGSRDDVRRWFVEKLREDEECEALDYDTDVRPWIGDRAAVAAIPNADHVADPVFAIQVKDREKATKGLETIFATCHGGEDYGSAFVGDYLLVAESDDIARQVAKDATAKPLAEDADFKRAMETVGDLGVVTAYVSEDGPRAIYDASKATFPDDPPDDPNDACKDVALGDGSAGSEDLTNYCTKLEADTSRLDRVERRFDEAMKDFHGAAGTLRFDGGGVELELAGIGVPGLDKKAGPTTISDLPASTVAAMAFAMPKGWAGDLQQQLEDGMGQEFYDRLLPEAGSATGLDLPKDLETLLGDSVVLAVDGETDWSDLQGSGPSAIKGGARIEGDEVAIVRLIDRLKRLGGAEAGRVLKTEPGEGRVSVGFNEDYLTELNGGGDLGEQDRFRDSVPHPDDATFALFIDFDAADHWLDRVVAESGDQDDVGENVKPLSALGVGVWLDDDGASHFRLKLSTD